MRRGVAQLGDQIHPPVDGAKPLRERFPDRMDQEIVLSQCGFCSCSAAEDVHIFEHNVALK